MKIIYFANHGNSGSDDTEGHILHALQQLGHEVLPIHQQDAHKVPASGYDMFLFHKGGSLLNAALTIAQYPKVCWYFDKVDWNGRQHWMKEIIQKVDMVAITDEAWSKRNPDAKIRIVRQGIGDRDTKRGVPRPDRWKAKVAFLGSVYGERGPWTIRLQKRYHGDFAVFGDVFNRDLYDFCETVPVIVAPPYPSEDWYWSSRIYMIMGSGGFMIHPRLAGLEREYAEFEHFIAYSDEQYMFEAIDYYLEHSEERKNIRLAGYQKTISNYTYTKRTEELLKQFSALASAHR